MTQPIYTNENKIVTLILKNNTVSDNRVISEQKRLRIEKEFNTLSDGAKNIILTLSQHNGVSIDDLSNLTKINSRTLRYHLKKLMDISLIEKHGKGERDLHALYTL